MKTSKIKLLKKEDKRSYGIQVTKLDNGFESDRFIIPVVDVRDGKHERAVVANQIKKNNRSKYMQPSFSVTGKSYQVSHKKSAL